MEMASQLQRINSPTTQLVQSPAMLVSMADIHAKKPMLDITHHQDPLSSCDVMQAPINQAPAKRVALMQTWDITFQKKEQPLKNPAQLAISRH